MDTEFAALPFWRDLQPAALEALAPQVVRHELGTDTRIIREGDQANSMYFLARGSVRITRGDTELTLGTINAPTLFGEMALVATTPRLASVLTNEPSLVFEVSRDSIFAIAGQYPSVRDIILVFHRDRLMKDILASNPLFAPISDQNKLAMAAGFHSETVSAGQVLLQEGQQGIGLYVLLRGRCEVFTEQNGKVGELSEGDVFGEISIVLFDRPCTATVRALTDCVTLLLNRELFQKTIMSHPKTRENVIQLALERLKHTEAGADEEHTKVYLV